VKRLAVFCAVGFPLVVSLSACEHYLAMDIRNDTMVTVTLCGSEPMRGEVCKAVEPSARASFKWGNFKVVSGPNQTVYSPRLPTREERLSNLRESAIYLALQNDGRVYVLSPEKPHMAIPAQPDGFPLAASGGA
jgi:hypothetical protein